MKKYIWFSVLDISTLLCPGAYDAIKTTLSKPKIFINSTTLIGGQCRS